MATSTLPQLLESLQKSVVSVSDATPKLSALTPPEDGLSLLDVKNELLLSYLEHMVFLILLKLRRVASSSPSDSDADLSLETSDLGQSVVKKLVELRLYLEKGVRPLEEKLRYQVEKALRAAEEVERTAKQKTDEAEAAAAESDSDSDSDADSDSGSDAEDDEDEDAAFGNEDEESASRPNRSAFVRPATSTAAAAAAKAKVGGSGAEADSSSVGVYRPPKIAPTMMPTTERREKRARGPLKSATMDEFIADELSTAPIAELSVGANIAGRGRHMTTAAERQREDERREYEEANFVRMPKTSKKERAKRAAEQGGSSQMSFGGEEWRGLGEGVDRINRLTQRKSGGGGAAGTRSMLDKSRKRGIDTIDGPRGSGAGAGHEDSMVGGRFQKKLRLHQVGRRDRGKK
ncbi:U3 small nucleolar ribonucleoprotein LCP5 [Sporothrix schenckii 1099-18]|uniref:Uncharacterized protein n=2 Tax=Sporothrix schenckii TaxID=29908 RepID=U7Q7N1_SPOS1|nr:U3 small nucleolar ribonucleoprotein LCP5 [Sporothrix schenckii 1099-18]ERT03217.1 hypothetical protein HMPREF1624_01523 [Sporothrix schenckii ATCC 58251]KJR84360.1 U3 small nucleolar ribonucleoprotein LCP5 [Sporothrix schenckii 1099-18]